MFIDTHAHLSNELYEKDVEEILRNAKSNGVDKIISIGCNLKEATESANLADKYQMVYSSAGLYPHDNKEESNIPDKEKLKMISIIASHPKVVAIGECGLDYKKPSIDEVKRSKDEQKDLFRMQIELSREVDLPVIIHSRYATLDTLKILKEEMYNSPFRAVWHCFGEDENVAKDLIEMGLMISITGIVTYPNAEELSKTVRSIPIESIMLETDSPFLLPQQLKNDGGKWNEPAYVKIIGEEIARIKGISADEVGRITSQNATNFFKL